MNRRVFITVAETSGDRHAGQLVRSLRQLDPSIQVEAYGGPELAAAGATLLRETVADAAMLHHGAKRTFEVTRLLKEASQYYRDTRPDLHICVDSSAMNLYFARRAKEEGIPVLYYVAPQLWASREGRMKKLRAYVDRLACILPFEEPYFRSHGVNATFVGHPLFDEIPPRDAALDEQPRFPDRPPVIGIVPGSRKSEVEANLPHQLDVARRITDEFPEARFLIPTTTATDPVVARLIEEAHGWPSLGLNRENLLTHSPGSFDEFIPQCDLCLCKSGTSTLHVAAHGVPMIVVYRVSPVLWHLLGRWLIRTKKIALVNILAGQTDLVPEFVPWYGSNEPVAACAIEMLRQPQHLQAQREKLNRLIATLDKRGASMNVARMAMKMMSRESGVVSSADHVIPEVR